jgi:hypothetical protein
MTYCKTKQHILTEDIRSCLLPLNPAKPGDAAQNITALSQVLSEYVAEVTPYENVPASLEAIIKMLIKATLLRSEIMQREVERERQ